MYPQMRLPSNKTASIIVVTAGLHPYLPQCLASLSRQTYAPCEVLLIDNSPDGIGDPEASRVPPTVTVYRGADSRYYCQALNKGIQLSGGAYVLCLNDDVLLDPRFIEKAMSGFAVHPRIGMVTGKLVRLDRKTIDSTGLFLTPWRTARDRGYGQKDCGRFEQEGYVFGVSGAAAFFRREMLEDVREGGDFFDSGFGMFYEDLDIAWRAQRRGWKAYYVPEAHACHVRGASTRGARGIDRQAARRFLNEKLHASLIRNRYLAIIKNETIGGFVLHVPFILLYDSLQWVYLLFFRIGHARSVLRNSAQLVRAFRKRRRHRPDEHAPLSS